jgi:2-dehydro-3-deoxygluconokinase
VRVDVVGECLIELVRAGPDRLAMRAAGDTFNTASMLVRASRALQLPTEVAYVTGLGDDPLSDAIAEALPAHGLVDASVRLSGRTCGVYLLDGSSGAMWYWRSDSAAHALFQDANWIPDLAPDLAFLSLITLQQMSERCRDRTAEWLAAIRSDGAVVAFSANHRAAGWPSRPIASAAAETFIAAADLVVASAADCHGLFDTAEPEAALARLVDLGATEAVLTAGADGAFIAAGDARLHVHADEPSRVVDPTGAGDAFAGTYVAWRLAGRPPDRAAGAAVGVASATVAYEGPLPMLGSIEDVALDRAIRLEVSRAAR